MCLYRRLEDGRPRKNNNNFVPKDCLSLTDWSRNGRAPKVKSKKRNLFILIFFSFISSGLYLSFRCSNTLFGCCASFLYKIEFWENYWDISVLTLVLYGASRSASTSNSSSAIFLLSGRLFLVFSKISRYYLSKYALQIAKCFYYYLFTVFWHKTGFLRRRKCDFQKQNLHFLLKGTNNRERKIQRLKSTKVA